MTWGAVTRCVGKNQIPFFQVSLPTRKHPQNPPFCARKEPMPINCPASLRVARKTSSVIRSSRIRNSAVPFHSKTRGNVRMTDFPPEPPFLPSTAQRIVSRPTVSRVTSSGTLFMRRTPDKKCFVQVALPFPGIGLLLNFAAAASDDLRLMHGMNIFPSGPQWAFSFQVRTSYAPANSPSSLSIP